jgi:hypothetical protein
MKTTTESAKRKQQRGKAKSREIFYRDMKPIFSRDER